MAWFAELAGKAENLLNNLDEQTGAALRSRNVIKQKNREYVTNAEPVWNQKKRPIPRALKKIPTITETRLNYSDNRKTFPITTQHSPPIKEVHSPKIRRSPTRKLYNLNNCPRTLVGDLRENDKVSEEYAFKNRRLSLPSNLDGICSDSVSYQLENIEIENAMLKNELNVTHREVADLLERLRRTEDELASTNKKLENSAKLNEKVNADNASLNTQLERLNLQIHSLTTVDIAKYRNQRRELESEVSVLRSRNKELEDKIQEINDRTNEKETANTKVENELRHAQSTINALQNDLDKSNEECKRLEKDWETYKNRVKCMLAAKDKEIKALQQGIHLTEDTRILVAQIENLKGERETLSDAVTRVRGECEDMKQYMETLETRHSAAERVVVALRDALKDERAARNRAETQCNALSKELKSIQIETGQTIASLRSALREKDIELNRLRDTSSSFPTSDTSALNVADYDNSQESIDKEKMYYLTQKLVQRQNKIESLLADNNMMKIQLDKLESKYKSELLPKRQVSHSVVHFQDNVTNRSRTSTIMESGLYKLSRRIGIIIRRYPIFRIFVIIYMICLHFWVLTVLFTSTPESYVAS